MRTPELASSSTARRGALSDAACCLAMVAAAGTLSLAADGLASEAWAAPRTSACNESLKNRFKSDKLTTIVAVKQFRTGDDLTPGAPEDGKATADLCMVRLLVGPGNPGPADAPSTSKGIGIEVWLPAQSKWNGRLRVLGGGGYSGRLQGVSQVAGEAAAGSIAAITNAGHAPLLGDKVGLSHYQDGAFLLDPNGKISKAQARDFGHRGVHETALKAKALSVAFFGTQPKYSYFTGGSGGGRQGLVAAQAYPEDFDGVLTSMPAINWTRMIRIYPHIIMQQELGRPIAPAKLKYITSAAISACDSTVTGMHDGFISDVAACTYNPVEDPNVLCVSDGGTNQTPICLTRREAETVNKIWYGPTVDGNIPHPAVGNGYGTTLAPGQLWFGFHRGSDISNMADSKDGQFVPSDHATSQLAITLRNSKLAGPTFKNAAGNGENGWRDAKLTYADFAKVQAEGAKLEKEIAPYNGNDPNLTGFMSAGGKIIMYHGMADEAVAVAGSTNYYGRVIDKIGSLDAVRKFFKYYMVPGLAHGGPVIALNGLAGISPPNDPPRPSQEQMFGALVDWVERGVDPHDMVVSNGSKTMSRPLCAYPEKITYIGGEASSPQSYSCN